VHALYDGDDVPDELVLEDEVHELSETLERFERSESAPDAFDGDDPEEDPFDLGGGANESGGDFGEGFDESLDEPRGASFGGSFDEPFDPEASDFVGSASVARDADELEDEFDREDFYSLEDDLSRPPSPEELRAILGSAFARHARALAVAAVAAFVGGLLIAWLRAPSQDPDVQAPPPAADVPISNADRGRASPSQATQFDDPAWRVVDSPEPVLARVRGPLRTTTPDESATSPRTPAGIGSENPGNAVAAGNQRDETDLLDDELIDLRPASMLPKSHDDPPTSAVTP
jgi:hypothetical protein